MPKMKARAVRTSGTPAEGIVCLATANRGRYTSLAAQKARLPLCKLCGQKKPKCGVYLPTKSVHASRCLIGRIQVPRMGNVTKQASTRFSIVKRSKGQSAVEKASYISRSVPVSEFDGQNYRPKYHEDLVHSEITLPLNAPKEYADRATLWNVVELSEKGQKSQLARMLKASLPNEWSYELAEEVVRDYVQRNFVDKGMCADWAIHDSENDKGQRNLHIHVLLTLRPIAENGERGEKQKKIYDLDENGEKIPVID